MITRVGRTQRLESRIYFDNAKQDIKNNLHGWPQTCCTVHVFWGKNRVLLFKGVTQSPLCDKHEVTTASVGNMFSILFDKQNILSFGYI